ncbi:MAG: hypothetical protein ACLGHQ_04320 [Acidimicrobiia bacterium]
MAWDSTRPVPWRRLIREWLVYVAVMAVVFVLFFRDNGLIGIMAGLLVSGPLYLVFGFVLAKLGYQRKTWKELRDEPRPERSRDETSVAGPRPKPAPTRRTGGASGAAAGRPGGNRKKRR